MGLDRAGVENYQITLGGDGTEATSLGERLGPGFPADQLFSAIESIIDVYLTGRHHPKEDFLAYVRRVGLTPFKTRLYPPLKKTSSPKVLEDMGCA